MPPPSHKDPNKDLRRIAEKKIQKKHYAGVDDVSTMNTHDLRRLVHELSVHQVELEMQNETLRQTQNALEEAKERYSDLYDFAPVGYVSIDQNRIIRSANLTAADLLATNRDALINKGFSTFIAEPDRAAFLQFIQPLSQRNSHGWMEARVVTTTGREFHARLEGQNMGNSEKTETEILLCLSDISQAKHAEAELKKTRDQLRQLAAHLQSVREEERSGIAREIHDEMAQVMAYLKFSLHDIETRIPESDQHVRKSIKDMNQALAQSISSTKNLISRLRPYLLDELGLIPALESYIRKFRNHTGINTDLFIGNGKFEMDGEKETAVYRIVQEALSNTARHSEARNVVISLSRSNGEIVIDISDDGTGMNNFQENTGQNYGLLSMRERAISCGGDVSVQSEKDRGTRVTARIPNNSKSNDNTL